MITKHFRNYIIRPTLKAMDMWTPTAENLLLGTAIHESGGLEKIKQDGNGPALGYYQMEPDTLDDLYENYLRFRPNKKKLLDQFKIQALSNKINLRGNQLFATAAARLQYYRVPEAIPEAIYSQAAYWKKYWNTEKGAGTVQKYMGDWNHWSQ